MTRADLPNADVSQPPFALPAPLVHVVHLPMPPSVNRIWRAHKAGKAKVSMSPAYRRWIKDCDEMIMAHGGMRGRKTIYGRFRALIELKRPSQRSDLDNRVKAVFDYAQRIGLIEDDKHCMEYTARWSIDISPSDCRLTLTGLA